MNIENIKVSDLIPYEYNTKIHDKKQVDNVAESIRRFGFVQPVVVDANNVIVIGHCRTLARKKLKMQTVPCVRVDDLTDEEIRLLRIADNKTNESPWDFENLKLELESVDLSGFKFEFEIPEREEFIETTDDDFDEYSPVESRSKLGDIWKLGNHRLICGDSTDPSTIERLMNGEKADLLLTDPPYNVDYEGKTKDALKIQNDKMEDTEYKAFLTSAFMTADGAMRNGASFYICHADSEGYNFRSACFDTGWIVRQCLIWVKNSMVIGRQDYQWRHEPILYGWKGGAGHKWMSDRKQTTILEFDRPTRSLLHPTMKPIALFSYLLQNNTSKGDIVLDTFGGSGTTIIACEQTNRRGYMCELDPHYCDVILSRWETFTGGKAELIERA